MVGQPSCPGPRGDARHPVLVLATLALLLLPGRSARAEDARALLAESEARHRSRTQEYSGELTVFASGGRVRKKAWSSYREGYAGDARQLIRFNDPPEVKGVGFLSLAHPGKNPDQWLYLPSMKRERRIAAQDRESSFVGTDFNYEDMEEFDHRKYEVSQASEERLADAACWRIEARPREPSVYQKRILWLRKDNLYLVQVESYKKGASSPAKRFLLSDLAEVDGHQVARRLEMTSLEKGSRTVVLLNKIAFDRVPPPDRFTLQNLNREGGD